MPTFIRLTDYKSSDAKEESFFDLKNKYKANQDDFERIPGLSFAYWINQDLINSFQNDLLGTQVAVKKGMDTGNNDLYLRFWHEVESKNFGIKLKSGSETIKYIKTWVPYNKGGEQRKWYGNNEYTVNWAEDGMKLKNSSANLRSKHLYFKNSITWNALATNGTTARFSDQGALFDSAGSSMFPDESINYYLSFMNTKIVDSLLKILNPTLNFGAGTISKLPIIMTTEIITKQNINQLTQQNIDISKQEWDSREISWDFTKNELLKYKQDGSVENALTAYRTHWTEQFNTLHANEEKLNKLFIDIYGLQDELTPDIALEDITILKTEKKILNGKLDFQNSEIIKQFISYSVGCMLGRYSLDKDGLIIVNLNQEIPTDTTYEIDDDNIIPIVDESDYFSDDMTDRFTEFVRTTFGSEKLQQNIAFIETSIGKKLRAYFQKDFYVDHTKRYKKRPIYWLFTSPKGTFQTLIYMHRYTPDTLNNILNDYLRPFRIRLDTMREESMRITESESSSSRDKTDADRKIDKIDKTLDDINEYEKTLAHYAAMRIEIDLDDGVKVNYCKFKELLFEFDKKLCK